MLRTVPFGFVAGARRVHALQGGSPAFDGRYLPDTWCGIQVDIDASCFVESSGPATCRRCLRGLAALDRNKKEKRP